VLDAENPLRGAWTFSLVLFVFVGVAGEPSNTQTLPRPRRPRCQILASQFLQDRKRAA
jgi:hypothetical protein